MTTVSFRSRSVRAVRAFTLVELLVVIGIIALLIGILLPSLSAARASSVKLKCAAGMHAIGQTMQQYANDYEGWIPRDYNIAQMDQGHLLWAELYLPYLAQNQNFPPQAYDLAGRDTVLGTYFLQVPIYHCPGFIASNHALDYGSNSWVQNSDDGVTVNGVGISAAQPMTKIVQTPRPAETCFLIETYGLNPNDNFDVYDIKDHTCLAYDLGVKNTSPRMINDNRHRGDTNILYYDGHVSPKDIKLVVRDDFRTILQ